MVRPKVLEEGVPQVLFPGKQHCLRRQRWGRPAAEGAPPVHLCGVHCAQKQLRPFRVNRKRNLNGAIDRGPPMLSEAHGPWAES